MKIVYSVWQQCMLDSHNYNKIQTQILSSLLLVAILMIKAVVYPDVLIAAAKRLCVKRIWTDEEKAAVQAGRLS